MSESFPMHLPYAPMHRLFLIQELLAIICEHLRNDHSDVGGRTLASLARTSKIFHHVATSALWSNLNGLAPLLKTLASDLTFYGHHTGAGLTHPYIHRPLLLQRPLKKAEWESFRSRASRVKHLRVNNPFRPVDVSIVRTLCNPPTTSPLFPNLRSILWNDERPETFSFIRTLSGPTVTSVTISITKSLNTWQATELGILTSLPYLCPNVTQVSLPTSAFVDGVSSVSETLSAWGKLTEINCGGIDPSALVYLAGQPTLRKLSFALPNGRAWLDSLPSGAFFSVHDFKIHAANLSLLCAFISRLGGSLAPASMRMQVCTNPPASAVNSLFSALGGFQLQDLSLRLVTQPRPQVIQNAPPAFPYWQLVDPMHPGHPPAPPYYPPIPALNHVPLPTPTIHMASHVSQMSGLPYPPPPSTFHVLSARDFAPLTFFENLGRIDINIDHGISLNDDDLKSLFSSWPQLYSFSLNDIIGWRVKSGITHVGLLAMLKLCPNLQTLCIALNTDSFKEVPSERPGRGIENTSLQILGLADSSIESREAVAVAAFLSDIFPNLTNITAWDSVVMMQRPNATVYVERWTLVCDILKGINKVRQQERDWQQLFTLLNGDDGES